MWIKIDDTRFNTDAIASYEVRPNYDGDGSDTAVYWKGDSGFRLYRGSDLAQRLDAVLKVTEAARPVSSMIERLPEAAKQRLAAMRQRSELARREPIEF